MTVKKVTNFLKGWILPALLYLVFAILSKGRLATGTMLLTIIQQATYAATIAVAMFNVFCMGFWEMGSVSVFTLSLILAGNITLNNGWGLGVLIILVLVFNVILCLLECVVLRTTRIPSMILTFAMVMIYENVAAMLYNGAFFAPREWSFFNRSPWCFILLIMSFVALYFVIYKTKFGFNVRAIGNGQKIAETVGIDFRKTMYFAYGLEGVLLVSPALIYLSQSGSANALVGLGTTDTAFDATVSCLISGYLSKYCGSLAGIFIGSLSMKILTSGLLALGCDTAIQRVAKGLFLILFLTLAENLKRISQLNDRRIKIKEIEARMAV